MKKTKKWAQTAALLLRDTCFKENFSAYLRDNK